MRYFVKMIPALFFVLLFTPLFAQETFTVTESAPATAANLQFGYNIVSEKEKEVGDKGNFSRYSLNFFVTNTSPEAKIIFYKPGFNLLGNDVSPTLVFFKCLNATGARLTSKEVQLQAKACNIMAAVEDKDCASGKTVMNKRFAQIGYWIKPGETISARTIVIVPLNERPDVRATLFSQGAFVGSAVGANYGPNAGQGYGGGGSYPNNQQQAPPPQRRNALNIPQNFVKLKNVSANIYLNNEGGPLTCSTINNDWWSAHWQFIPVEGTNYFRIKNQWKETFLGTDNSSMLSNSEASGLNMWTIEPAGYDAFYIKNAGNTNALVFQNGRVQMVPIYGEQQNAKWVIEQ